MLRLFVFPLRLAAIVQEQRGDALGANGSPAGATPSTGRWLTWRDSRALTIPQLERGCAWIMGHSRAALWTTISEGAGVSEDA